MAGQASRENGKKGGRPPGRKNSATIEREAVLRAYRNRVCEQADRLLDAELTVALGCSMLFKKPKEGKERKAERVTDEATIKAFLDGELDDSETEWYFITTERPDSLTIRNMFDRTFDKPMQRTELTGRDGQPLMTRVVHEEHQDDQPAQPIVVPPGVSAPGARVFHES